MGSYRMTARKVVGAFVAVVCVLGLWAGPATAARKPLPKPVPVANDALARALASGRLTPAGYALQRARSLFRLGAVREEFGDVARADKHDATLIMRDLALRLRQLPAAQRAEGESLLARPTDSRRKDPDAWSVPEAAASPACDANVCIHWVASTRDAPPLADGDADGVPDWIEDVVQPTFANVWSAEIDAPPTGLGNPAPLSDLASRNDGGDGRLDVYLTDLGDDFVFGYCTSDDPNLRDPDYPFFAFSAYCVLDDNFRDFGTRWTPEQFNQIVAAHEFRHASQFAEDAAEDAWLMEGEAMWIEGQVYPTITDRFRYLDTSPLSRPGLALDHGAGHYEYGAWVFFRYLSERFGEDIIRQVWDLADDNGSSPDQYSMEAVGSATSARGESLASSFTLFTRWNRSPAGAGHYDEGADYPTPGAVAAYALKPSAPTTGWKTVKLRHLASAHYSLRPGRGTRSTSSVKVTVDLPNRVTKPAATLLVFFKSGAYSAKPISLDSSGNGAKTVSFGKGVVSRVDVLLTNASARFDPATQWSGTTSYSWGGAVAIDENRAYSFKAKLR